MKSQPERVAAIVGAGPAGLVTARYLREVGIRPVLFEQGDAPGGQWRVGAPYSSVWPGMRTNTSRVTTAFSDLPHPDGTVAYPAAEAMGAYLERYAQHGGIHDAIRMNTRVELINPLRGNHAGWEVRSRDKDGTLQIERFSHVVVASGRYHQEFIPPIAGLDTFAGSAGVSHVKAYRGAEPFRGMRVLVCGHSISAVEIASELALKGAARVVLSARRHRYVLQKLMAGVPIEHRVYTRYAALAAAGLPAAVTAARFKELILRTSGHPSQFGAPCAADNPYEAGFTQNQFYLPLVAEGRIKPQAWLHEVRGDSVAFADGTTESFDAIVMGTGYSLHLPFLGPTVREALQLDAQHADLHDFTFHPDLRGLAFAGLFEQSGPYFATLELQGRWIAYSWGGRCVAPSNAEMQQGIRDFQGRRGTSQVQRMHLVARRFARAIGVDPDPARWPELARAVMFGVMSPASFRLEGPDALTDAPMRVARDVAEFGALPGGSLTAEERDQLVALSAATGDTRLKEFVATLP
jgi:dimethylaniline monooxygenase (N-oxide forming)